MAKYLDQDGLLYFWQQLKTLFAGKVDKVSGKGLSTNDFTNADQTKLNGIETGAEVNVLEGVNVNGTAATITNKIAAVAVPTKTSDLTNDSGYITSADVPEGAAASTTTPKMDGTASTGTETAFARGDHIHPKDTSKANLASPTFTGTPAGPTAAAGTNTTQLATTAFVQTAISGKQDTLTFDNTPTSGSSNPVTSGGIYTALGNYLTTSDAASTYATKSEISTAYRYKGSVASVSNLPSTGNTVGDVYNVEATDMNYAWTGTAWDQLGGTFTITSITNAEIDAIMAA